ncbi:MAG: TadE/TadG family type IV pilus assembly protein [Ornithinibacter sp.]
MAIEMAIVLPLLLLTLGGIVDFGRMFFTQVVITNAAREGARAAVVLKTGSPNGDIEARALAAANGVPDASAVVDSNCTGGTLPPDANAKVTVTAPMSWFFLPALGVSLPSSISRVSVMGCT